MVDSDADFLRRAVSYMNIQGLEANGFLSLLDLNMALMDMVPDVLTMEIDFPEDDAFKFLRKLKMRYNMLLIVLSVRSSESDRITSFELGCDDFVAKPCSLKELQLRILRMLARKNQTVGQAIAHYRLRSSQLMISYDSHIVMADDRDIKVTASEWKVLISLVDNAGTLVTRQQLLSACFPENLERYDRIIDTYIKNIRAKLGTAGVDWIETIRGYGYRFMGIREII